MAESERLGYRVIGTIKGAKGTCTAGHKMGDLIEVSSHNSGGLCGFLYHHAFPYILMLEFGGGFPAEWGDPDVIELDCIDRGNTVTIELKRIRD